MQRHDPRGKGKSFFTAEDAENAEELQLQVPLEKLPLLQFLCVRCVLCGKKKLLPRGRRLENRPHRG